MRFIDSKIHGVIDYLSGPLFIISPWLFGFSDIGVGLYIPMIIGFMILFISIITKYEYGVFSVVPLHVHLNIDIVSGIFLIASPWIFGFSDVVFWPYVILGLIEVVAGMFTFKKPRSRDLMYN